jgi:radical SAM-linked protein
MFKLRFCFEKNGPAAYISHLDLMKALQRSFVRAGIPVKYSQGFNPHIEMSIVVPLSTGYETRCDLCDLDLVCDEMPSNFVEDLNAVMPRGMKVLHAGAADRPVREIAYSAYEIVLPAGDTDAMKALQAGHNIKAGVYGMAVICSHGRERTHITAIENTANLTLAYLLEG